MCALTFLIIPCVASAQRTDTVLTVTNQDGVVKRFTIAELRKMPQIEVKAPASMNDTNKVTERGPSLRVVLTAAGAPTGQALRGPNMLLVVVAEASDGYKAAYTLAELDEQFGGRDGIVALTENGRPISETDGPMRIVVAGEMHRARWVRKVPNS